MMIPAAFRRMVRLFVVVVPTSTQQGFKRHLAWHLYFIQIFTLPLTYLRHCSTNATNVGCSHPHCTFQILLHDFHEDSILSTKDKHWFSIQQKLAELI